jgi:hypothetical protein
MPRRLFVTFMISISLFVLWSCDDTNLVEPQFGSDDDVVDIPNCNFEYGAPPVLIEENGNEYIYAAIADSVHADSVLPGQYSFDVCWHDLNPRHLVILFQNAHSDEVYLAVINKKGEVEFSSEGYRSAGDYIFGWTAEEAGVYAVSIRAGEFSDIIWFEVK